MGTALHWNVWSPIILTMGIMNQLPEPTVELPADPQNMCIVG